MKERKKVEAWVNFYPDRIGGAYGLRETADRFAANDRIACLHVEGYEGDGL